MRSDELIHIQRKHISIHDHMEIYIPRRKNDQYNLGHKVFISRSSKDTCPVAISSRYLKLLPQNPDQSLVCRLSYSRHGCIAHQQAISYSRVREIFLSALKETPRKNVCACARNKNGGKFISHFCKQKHGL